MRFFAALRMTGEGKDYRGDSEWQVGLRMTGRAKDDREGLPDDRRRAQNDCGKAVNKLLPLTRKAIRSSKAIA